MTKRIKIYVGFVFFLLASIIFTVTTKKSYSLYEGHSKEETSLVSSLGNQNDNSIKLQATATVVDQGVFGTAGYGGGNNTCYWELRTDGYLEIRPLSAAQTSGGCFISKWYDTSSNSKTDKSQNTNVMYQWPWQKYKNQVTKIVLKQKIYTDKSLKLNYMFSNYPELVEVDASQLEVTTKTGNENQSFFSRVEEAEEMFANNPKLETVNLSGFRNNGGIWSMKRMFYNCPNLKTVILNNSGFKTRSSENNGAMMLGFFYGSDNLEYVDFSNITIGGRKEVVTYSLYANNYELPKGDYPNKYENNWIDFAGFDNLFLNKTKLHTVKLTNTKVNGMKGFASMFENCTSLKEWNGETGLEMTGFKPSSAVDMRNMFKNTAFTKLDISGFGKLNNILNMNGFIEGVSTLKILNMDNLDNSNIGPYNKKHRLAKIKLTIYQNYYGTQGADAYSLQLDKSYPATLYKDYTREYISYPDGYWWGDSKPNIEEVDVTKEESMITGAVEYGREIFGIGVYDITTKFPNLKVVSLNNANVWLVKNNKGLAGAEYYTAANDSDVLYLFNTKTELKQEGKDPVEINSKRDYIDLIIDRDSVNRHTTIPEMNILPDAKTNKNILYDLNPNGAGHLAPGVYTISKDAWEEESLDLPETYYRIAYIGDVPFRIEGIDVVSPGKIGTDPELNLVRSDNYAWLNTKTKDNWPTNGDYTIDRTTNPIKFIYENAAEDVNGKKHNVIITIKKITFKNLERIPTHAGNTRTHDFNKYIDFHPSSTANENNPSKWTLSSKPNYYRTVLQASKTDGITFRNYIRVGSGYHTPGISTDWQVLSGGSGTDIDFSIEIEGANPDTSFLFLAEDLDIGESQNWNKTKNDADFDNLPVENSVYGLGGESFVLGEGNELDSLTFASSTGLKLVNENAVITTGTDPNTSWSSFVVKSKASGADFTWKTGIGCATYALINTPKSAMNAIEIEPIGKVLVGGNLLKEQFTFTLTPDDSVDNNKAIGISKTATNDEFGNVTFGTFIFDNPGTANDSTNTHGNGQHLTATYAWIVSEEEGNDENILYDTTPKKLKIIVSTPETDLEMLKGIKAQIFVDDKLVNTVWSKELINNKYTTDLVFKNVVLKEVTLKNYWVDDDNEYGIRPEDLNGFITIATESLPNNVELTYNTEANKWVKSTENYWTYTFKIPANMVVKNWGENSIPEGYIFEKSSNNNDIYEIKNLIEKYDLTITKKTPKDIDKNEDYTINIKIFDQNNNLVIGKFNAKINGAKIQLDSIENGITYILKNDDVLVIEGIKAGYKYEILCEEKLYTEYYNVVNDESKTIVNTTKGFKYQGTIDDNYTITFTNSNEKIVDDAPSPKTGDNVLSYVILSISSVIVIVFLIIIFIKKKTKK